MSWHRVYRLYFHLLAYLINYRCLHYISVDNIGAEMNTKLAIVAEIPIPRDSLKSVTTPILRLSHGADNTF